MFFFVVCCLFSKSFFFINSFRNTIRVTNSLDPDQARHFVGPDLGPSCLQRLPADDTSMLRVNYLSIHQFFHKMLSFQGKDHFTDKIS